MTDRPNSLERKASTSSKKSKESSSGARSSPPGAPGDGSLLTPMVRSKRTPIACTECRRRQVKCSGGTPRCERCEKRGVKCEYIPIHVQRQQSAAAAAAGAHAMMPVSSVSRSLPTTPLPWPPSGASSLGPPTRHSPVPYRDWPEYYDLSAAEMAPDARRPMLPHSAPSYLGADSFSQSLPGPSYARYQSYDPGMATAQHYPGPMAEAYAASPGSSGSPVGQPVDFALPMEHASQLMPGANPSPSYPNQYLQGQGYYDAPPGATALHGQMYQGWADPSGANYSAFQGQSYHPDA